MQVRVLIWLTVLKLALELLKIPSALFNYIWKPQCVVTKKLRVMWHDVFGTALAHPKIEYWLTFGEKAFRSAWNKFVLQRKWALPFSNERGRFAFMIKFSIHPFHANISSPCFWIIASNFNAMPLGRLAPDSHFSTVDSLVLR